MAKALFIAEKPSVAQEFAKALKENMRRNDGYLESESYVITWCVGHLITMSYPEVYDPKYKRWSLDTLPFLPDQFLYEVIPGVKKQYTIVSRLLNRADVATIYVCTDSGREGEYIYRLVAQMAGGRGKAQKRVWIDSQTEEEILRGIRTAKELSAYDNLASAAYLRAKEDYLMGINFSRLLTLKYGNAISSYLGLSHSVVSVGRVMTCVLGMIVRREREIRQFVKTPFYRVMQQLELAGRTVEGEFRAVEGSAYFQSPKLYKENGFREEKDARELIARLSSEKPLSTVVERLEKKREKKNPPLLYNLAELQNECSRMFKISPDETLRIVQELYEKKLVTYPRTDARVLSSAVAKEISKNISGLRKFGPAQEFAEEVLENGSYKSIAKTRYVNDKQITDHYAIIPTGQGLGALGSLSRTAYGVYSAIVRRFMSAFYPPAEFEKVTMVTMMQKERFFFSFRVLLSEGYFRVAGNPYAKKQDAESTNPDGSRGEEAETSFGMEFLEALKQIRKGAKLPVKDLVIRAGETAPPKRYNSGSMILAMENAGQLIEDEELRAQIKSCGIGTSATRAEILKKLVANQYIALNKKTQILTPTLQGEMIHDVVFCSIRSLLNPELTASWEKGLNYVANGTITSDEYMQKLEVFVRARTDGVLGINNQYALRPLFDAAAQYYKGEGAQKASRTTRSSGAKLPDGGRMPRSVGTKTSDGGGQISQRGDRKHAQSGERTSSAGSRRAAGNGSETFQLSGNASDH